MPHEPTTSVIARCVVPGEAEGQHLDAFASGVFDVFPSKSSVRRAVHRGELFLDGRRVGALERVRAGQELAVAERAAHPHEVYARDLVVVYDSELFAVIDKPAGLPVNGNRQKTVENALPHNLSWSTAADALGWPRPVHRLDAPTSGLLLVAKTAGALANLSDQFHDRRVHKRYRAIVLGRLEGEGERDEPVEGRPARSRWRAVAHARSLRSEWLTTVDLWPLTGRRHQLRRHLAELGHPVLGDTTYGLDGLKLHGKGLFLRAVALGIAHPETGAPLAFEVADAPKFHTFPEREARRWRRYNPET